MSYESAVTALKALMKREMFELDPDEHGARVQGESDRAAIILCGSMLERFLVEMLAARMPGINSDERSMVFQFEGPCGSFSNRIRMAHALGVIDRKTRKRLDLIREMRNVAAHGHDDVGFQTPEIKGAMVALVDPAHRDIVEEMDRVTLRRLFEYLTSCLNKIILGQDLTAEIDAMFAGLRESRARILGDASPGK